MSPALTVFEMIGFFITVLSVCLFVAVDLVLATFGACIAWKVFVKGSALVEADLKRGSEVREGRIPGVIER